MTTVWPSRRSRRARPRAISRSPEGVGLSGGLSGVCNSTRMSVTPQRAPLAEAPGRAPRRSSRRRIEGEARAHDLARAARQAPAQVGIAHQAGERRRQFVGRAGRHQQAVLAVVDEFTDRRGRASRRWRGPGGPPPSARWAGHPGRRRRPSCWPARTGRRAPGQRTPPSAAGRRARGSARRCRARRPAPSERSESSPAPICSKRQWSAGGSLASASRRSS